jgi:hypothetical protein
MFVALKLTVVAIGWLESTEAALCRTKTWQLVTARSPDLLTDCASILLCHWPARVFGVSTAVPVSSSNVTHSGPFPFRDKLATLHQTTISNIDSLPVTLQSRHHDLLLFAFFAFPPSPRQRRLLGFGTGQAPLVCLFVVPGERVRHG